MVEYKSFLNLTNEESIHCFLCILTALSSIKDSWHKNCVTQTTSWSPCSKTCGRGVSLRITNNNKQCQMAKESRLCNIRPCEVDITKHIKVQQERKHQIYCNIMNNKFKKKRAIWMTIVYKRIFSDSPQAWKEVLEHLQGGEATQLHHVWLH